MGYLLVIASAFAYAGGIVAQTVAARRAELRGRLDIGLVARLAGDPVYVFGFAAQVAGFALAFLARADLPLYFVQAGATSAVGIAALAGAVLLGWRIRGGELVALAVLAAGLILLAGAAQPSAANDVSLAVGLGLLGVLAAAAGLAVFAARMTGPRGAVALGILAGAAFAVLAIASRPLAAGPLLEVPLQPLAWLMIGAAVVGQSLLAAALQRGSTTATMASMDAFGVLLASGAGLLLLGDQIVPGRGPWVAVGLALVVAGVVTMAIVARPPVTRDAAVAVPEVEVEEVEEQVVSP